MLWGSLSDSLRVPWEEMPSLPWDLEYPRSGHPQALDRQGRPEAPAEASSSREGTESSQEQSLDVHPLTSGRDRSWEDEETEARQGHFTCPRPAQVNMRGRSGTSRLRPQVPNQQFSPSCPTCPRALHCPGATLLSRATGCSRRRWS